MNEGRTSGGFGNPRHSRLGSPRYFGCASSFTGEFRKKRIALAAGRRIIAIKLPVVGEAVYGTETQMRNTLTNMNQDSYNDE
jgi:hypothetical protein